MVAGSWEMEVLPGDAGSVYARCCLGSRREDGQEGRTRRFSSREGLGALAGAVWAA